MKRLPFVLVIHLVAAGCAKGTTLDFESLRDVDGMGPVPAGYTRFLAAQTTLAPGEELIVDEWLAAPLDADVDIVDVRADAPASLHHLMLYGTTDVQPVGTRTASKDEDPIASGLRFYGGVGAKSEGRLKLPEGVAFRVSKGRSLLANVHYLNKSTETVTTRGWIDVKFAVPTPERQRAGMFTSLEPTLFLAPHAESSLDVSCKLQSDLDLFAWANHMRDLGVSISTEVDRAGGGTEVIRRDDAWQRAWVLDPQFSNFSQELPLTLHVGDTLRTHCTWNNTGKDVVSFPNEICLGFGFFAGDKDVSCTSGKWLE